MRHVQELRKVVLPQLAEQAPSFLPFVQFSTNPEDAVSSKVEICVLVNVDWRFSAKLERHGSQVQRCSLRRKGTQILKNAVIQSRWLIMTRTCKTTRPTAPLPVYRM